MKLSSHTKLITLLLGDIAALYGALLLALFIRYGMNFNEQFLDLHAVPFTIIFPFWLLIFYIAGLYDLPKLRNNLEFLQLLFLTLGICALITIAAFYLIPAFVITPRTNLFIFIISFGALEAYWRRFFNRRASFREGLNRVLLLDRGSLAHELRDMLFSSPQIGYTVAAWLDPEKTDLENIGNLIIENNISLVVVPTRLRHDRKTARFLYELLASGTEVRDTVSVYESVHRKVPVGELSDAWFVEHAIGERKFYDDLKRGLEFILAAFMGLVLFPLLVLIAGAVKFTSAGPAIYKQKRVGKHGRIFTLYKFRSMKALAADGSAETHGAVWTGIHDSRTTSIGRFLRATHLDELPQLWNVIRGELSFVGPRPERPEIVTRLAESIPYYEIRLIVEPGISGWAQINHRKDATTADVTEKLAYDIYYLKNRSLILDIAILIKTVKSFFVNHT